MPEPLTRKQKLLRLRPMVNLETGNINESAFSLTLSLYAKAKQKKLLDGRIRKCCKCPDLNIPYVTGSCPGWGDLNARIFLIGQSLHGPGIDTDIPFILGSGLLIDAALQLSNIKRNDVFFTNVIHCHPISNRASMDREKRNCLPHLRDELRIVNPDFIVTLGNDAKAGLDVVLAQKSMDTFSAKVLALVHPASILRGAPEVRVAWVLRLAKALDKYSEVRQ